MPSQNHDMSDTIRVLVATDNHVGYHERDPVRGDDSWKSFHEIMCLAKDRDVDMVLLGGDLFHDNVPSRKSMYNVMRSLRLNCYGDKPCELEILSDGSEHFDPTFGHANYEDMNINVSLPVFSIHGNHDDPSGDGHYAALDLLEMSGLINYFGRVPISDEIEVKPLMLQKGNTKLALYGLSNVRDERLYRSFRAEKVAYHRPNVQQREWYNIGVVHQNHHAHGPTSYLPENFLPELLDLVIWGHEHECVINPQTNAEMGFKVMQPGSSIATSLAPGEAVQKHVAILGITGREMKCEPVKLKTVRPFVYKEIILGTIPEAKKLIEKEGHRHKLTEYLMKQVDNLIAEAQQQWEDAQWEDDQEEGDEDAEKTAPLPLVRLRVEHTGINGKKFEIENPQRFSNRFTGRVANNHDVVQFHQKKRAVQAARLKASEELKELLAHQEMPEAVKVSKLVADFLNAQSLSILPQNYFGDAVNQYIDKDDKRAMEIFIADSLSKQVKHLVDMGGEEDNNKNEIDDVIEHFKAHKIEMEKLFAQGELKNAGGECQRYKPEPEGWDPDHDGEWEDQVAALIRSDDEDKSDEDVSVSDGTPKPTSSRGRGRGRGGRGATAATRGRATTASKKAAATKAPSTSSRGRKKAVDESEEEEEDVIMLDDDDDDEQSDSQAMFISASKGKKAQATNGSSHNSRAGSAVSNATKGKSTKPTVTSARKPPTRAAAAKTAKQSTLSFSASQASVFGNGKSQNVSDIEDDDDDDAFEPAPTTSKRKR